jgi:galactokinase
VPLEVCAFAPGRVNLIGEHTDYNRGLALPFAIAEGVTVRARRSDGPRIRALALDLDERDEFALSAPPHSEGWRAFVRGIAAELLRAGVALGGADLEISGEVPLGAGLSSSAALEVALGLALLALAGVELTQSVDEQPPRSSEPPAQSAGRLTGGGEALDRRGLAKLCARVENEWVGAHTGLLDQLASLFGEADAALLIDFHDLAIQPVPFALAGGWRLVTLDSGEPRTLAASGYNERRAECARACELLGAGSLREVGSLVGAGSLREVQEESHGRPPVDLALALGESNHSHLRERAARLPPTLARRVEHVLGENARVLATVSALHEGDLPRVGTLLDASHASLRDLYECSTPAVEATVQRLKQAGAAGARMVGGGFGGRVLGLFPPGASPPGATREVRPSRGAHLLARGPR